MSIGELSLIALAVAVGLIIGAALAVMGLGRVVERMVARAEAHLIEQQAPERSADPGWPADEPEHQPRHRLPEAETEVLYPPQPDPVPRYMREHLSGQTRRGWP